jgi:hypothetical protein
MDISEARDAGVVAAAGKFISVPVGMEPSVVGAACPRTHAMLRMKARVNLILISTD